MLTNLTLLILLCCLFAIHIAYTLPFYYYSLYSYGTLVTRQPKEEEKNYTFPKNKKTCSYLIFFVHYYMDNGHIYIGTYNNIMFTLRRVYIILLSYCNVQADALHFSIRLRPYR